MFLDIVINTIDEYGMIKKDDCITAALSGGADSVCLLIILKELSDKYSFTLDALHINHCIRGKESDRDEEFCRNLCKKYDIPLTVIRTDVPAAAAESKKSLEETARDIRYKAFEKHAGDKGKIATAHTVSDNAETVILNMARGTGLKGLCGIPPVRDNIIRPLIDVTRQQIEDYLKSMNQGFVTDSTNLSDDYTRNRIRHKIIPELLKINEGFYKTFSSEIKILKEENSFIAQCAEDAYRKCRNGSGVISGLDKYPDAVKKRIISMFFIENNLPFDYNKICSVCSLAEKNGKINIAKGVFIIGKNGSISIIGESERIPELETPLKIGRNYIFKNKVLIAEKNKKDGLLIDLDKVCGTIILRNLRYGDKIKLSGRDFTSSVKKLLNENIPSEKRPFIHYLSDDMGLIYVENIGVADRVKVTGESNRILSVKTEDVI